MLQKSKFYLPLNLQYFAEANQNGENLGEDTGDNTTEKEELQEEKSTYTKEEAFALAQTEAQKALKGQKEKYKKELEKQKKLSLSGMDEEARQKAAQEQRIAELEEQLAEYKLVTTKAEISKILSNRGLDANLVDFVVTTDDTEECMEKIETLEKIIKNIVKKQVDARLKTTSPKNGSGETSGVVTAELFKKMSIAEQNLLYEQNKDLYMELIKR